MIFSGLRKTLNTIGISAIMLMGALLSGCANYQLPSFGGAGQSARDGYGAIAFSPTTQQWHIRWNAIDQDRADQLATQYCGAGDCAIALRFGPGQCGTFSLGDNGALGVGAGTTEEDAKFTALTNCVTSGQTCKVAPIRCNDQL